MLDLWATIFPLLLADVLNPVLFAFMVFALSSPKPLLTSGLLLLGHTLAYFLVGLLLVVAMEKITHRLDNPEYLDYYIQLVIAVILVVVTLPAKKAQQNQPQPQQDSPITPQRAIFLGAVINLIGAPFAVPYFAVVSQILSAEATTAESLNVLILYNVVYAIPFLVVPVLWMVMGESARPMLNKINQWLDKLAGILMPVLLFGLGAVLLVDAVMFLVNGEPLL